ncbi:CHC2 zinc finger domain-containing protein [Cellulomonas sp. PSBB021]|uniref:CHC2 zinc finger domain-containing protein n=1 Tax=Cellulomonas sp. PSBB021 TaxID=2003551 RepID=UPI0012FD5C5C
MGACPFHEDDSPSLVITPSKNLWHCLGACGRGGGPLLLRYVSATAPVIAPGRPRHRFRHRRRHRHGPPRAPLTALALPDSGP